MAGGTTRPVEPKQGEFDAAGEFLSAHARWEREDEAWRQANLNGESQVADAVDPNAVKPEEVAETEAEANPDDVRLGNVDADELSVTPQALQEMLTADPALASALEANPAMKGKLFQMARRNAEMEPIAKLFPTVTSAEFAQKTAGEYVGLRSKFETAVVQPEKIADAFDAFVDQFRIVDSTGKPVLDERGQPKLAEDFNLLSTHMRKLDIEGSLAEIEARLAAGRYTNEAQREKDEQRQLAYQFLRDDADDAEADAAPDLSALPEDIRKTLEAREKAVKEREDALNGTKNQETQQAKQQARDRFENDFGQVYAKSILTQTEGVVAELRKAGAHIPGWMLEYKAPGSEVPVFYLNVLAGIGDIVRADPYLQAQSAKLQRLAPSPENLKARLEFFDGIARDNMRKLVVKEIKSGVSKSAPKPAATNEPKPNPSIEPRGGTGPVQTAGLTQDQAMAQARAELARELPDWADMTGSERNALALTRMAKLQRG